MATYFWVSAGSSTWATDANWSLISGGSGGAGIPGVSDDANFDLNGLGNCALVGAISLTNLIMTSGYTGELDAVTYAITISNNCTLGGTQVHMGTNTWTVAGDFDYQALTIFWAGTSTVLLTGTSKNIRTNGGSNYFYNLTIAGSYTLDVGNIWWSNDLKINSSKSLTTSDGTSGDHIDLNAVTGSGAQLHLYDSGILTLGVYSKLVWIDPTASGGVATMDANARIIGGSNATMEVYMTVGGAAGSGTWVLNTTHGWEVFFKIYGQHASAEFTFPNQLCKIYTLQCILQYGAYNFTIKPGGISTIVEITNFMSLVTNAGGGASGTLKIDNTGVANNIWRLQGDFLQALNGSTDVRWTQNSETIEVLGSSTHDLNFNFASDYIRNVLMDTSGAVTLANTGHTYIENLEVTSGTSLTIATSYDLYVKGDCLIRTGATWPNLNRTVYLSTGAASMDIEAGVEVSDIVNLRGSGTTTQVGDVVTQSLTMSSSGSWDCNTYDLTITTTGLDDGSSTVFDLSTGNITVNGNLDLTDLTSADCGIIVADTCTMIIPAAQTIDRLTVEAGGGNTLTLSGVLICVNLTLTSGTFETANNNVIISGDFYMDTGSYCNCGDGNSWDIGGSFNNVALGANHNFDSETCEIKMTGSGDIIPYNSGFRNSFYKLTIEGTYDIPISAETCTVGGSAYGTAVNGWLKITTGATLNIYDVAYVEGDHKLIVESGGHLEIQSGGSFRCARMVESNSEVLNDGLIDGVGTLQFRDGFASTTPVSDGDYLMADWELIGNSFGALYISFSAGTFNTKNLYIEASAGDVTLDMNINDPILITDGDVQFYVGAGDSLLISRGTTTSDWEITGDFYSTGTVDPITYVPGAGQILFTGSSDQTLDLDGATLESIRMDMTGGRLYVLTNFSCEFLTLKRGTFDVDKSDIVVNQSFQLQAAFGAVCYCGSGTFSVNGTFDAVIAGVTRFFAETSEFIMTGSGNINISNTGWFNSFYRLTIDGSYSSTSVLAVYNAPGEPGWLKVKAGATFTVNGTTYVRTTSKLIVENTGLIWVNTTLVSDYSATANGAIENAGAINGPGLLAIQYRSADAPISSGDYRIEEIQFRYGDNVIEAGTFQCKDMQISGTLVNVLLDLTADPTIITDGDVYLNSVSGKTLAIDRTGATNDWSITGNFYEVSTPGTHTYTGTTGTLTFNGSGDQSCDVDGISVDNVVVNKSAGTFTLSSTLSAESFTATDGTLDFNGKTITTTNNFTINAANGTAVDIVSDANAMNGVNMTVGNDFYVANVIFNATAAWNLDVLGTSALAYGVDVKYSDADAGLTIDATAASNTDLGINFNWDFDVAALATIHSLSIHCFPWVRMTNRSGRGFRRN